MTVDSIDHAVDVEVHCSPTSVTQLRPYLSRYWNDYFTSAEMDLPPSIWGAYPPNSPVTATPEARAAGAVPPDHVDQLREQVLDRRVGGISILQCLTTFAVGRNPYCESAVASAVNDWLRDEWLAQDDRLRASMVVPTLDVDAAVKEIDRVGDDHRFVQVLLPVRSHDARYGNVRFRPLLEAAARHNLVVGLHAWGRHGGAPTPTGYANTRMEDYLYDSQILAKSQLLSLMVEGCFDRLPSLRVALLECGFSWLPAFLWRLEKDWKALWREVPWMERKPAEYIRDNVRASIHPVQVPESDEDVARLLAMVNAPEFLMFSSDYPHNHESRVDTLLRALDDSARSAILRDNAMSFYGLA